MVFFFKCWFDNRNPIPNRRSRINQQKQLITQPLVCKHIVPRAILSVQSWQSLEGKLKNTFSFEAIMATVSNCTQDICRQTIAILNVVSYHACKFECVEWPAVYPVSCHPITISLSNASKHLPPTLKDWVGRLAILHIMLHLNTRYPWAWKL